MIHLFHFHTRRDASWLTRLAYRSNAAWRTVVPATHSTIAGSFLTTCTWLRACHAKGPSCTALGYLPSMPVAKTPPGAKPTKLCGKLHDSAGFGRMRRRRSRKKRYSSREEVHS
ncbi:unnamed protein product [Ixodes persulcatus]